MLHYRGSQESDDSIAQTNGLSRREFLAGAAVFGSISWNQAVSPQLSVLRPRPDHPEWDVAVWLDVLTIPGTSYADQFYRELETWIFGNYTGSYAMARPEWSKGWGYTNTAVWSDPTMLKSTIPNAYRAGQAAGDNWDAALSALDAYDPHRIFANAFLDTLLP